MEGLMQLVDGITHAELEAAWKIAGSATWSFYSSFLRREQEVIEKAVDVSSIRGVEGGARQLKDFLAQQQLKKMQQ
jgi:hypothetical protein